MTGPRKATGTDLWKRKRGRIIKARISKGAVRLRHMDEGRRLALLAHRVVLPLLLADVARRLGAPAISPKDFHCGCAPCAADGLPICEGVKANCRFAGRWTAERAAQAETRDALDEFEFHWELASMSYCGKRIPAALERALVTKF
ncbi:MAG: hypothetical protein CMI63_01610 [Parvularcula sp.]|nr:hypothetical protein [Parvularcula sp.]